MSKEARVAIPLKRGKSPTVEGLEDVIRGLKVAIPLKRGKSPTQHLG